MIYIYTLSHPTTFEIRYIGKTKDPKARLLSHLSKARAIKTSRHVCEWVKSLIAQDLKPVLSIIEITDEILWPEREKYWIARAKSLGSRLCNHTDGGESNYGYIASKETRDKMSKARLGRTVSQLTRLQIAATLNRQVVCIEDAKIFPSMKAAWLQSGVPKTTFHRKMKAGKKIKNKTYKYL